MVQLLRSICNFDQSLTDIAALHHIDKGFRRTFEPMPDIFAVDDLSIVEPGSHLLEAISISCLEIENQKSAHLKTFGYEMPEQSGSFFRADFIVL